MRRLQNFFRSTFFLTLILHFFPVNIGAQEGSPIIRIQSEIILVDLLVSDESGEFILDIEKAEIEILEDGKSQEITFFDLVDFSDDLNSNGRRPVQNLPKAIDSSRDLRRPNPFVIVIDLNNFEGGDLHFAQNLIQTFFSQQQFTDSDLFMLFAIRNGLKLLTDLTHNQEDILQMMNSLRGSAKSL